MVQEIAEITAMTGREAELEAGLRRGLEVIRRAAGCHSAQLLRCVEEHGRFVLMIEWATLEDHTVRFRGGPLFAEYRSHINGVFVEPVVARHYTIVDQ